MILKDQQEKKVYSDGEVTEQRMLEIAKKYPEDMAQDYIADCSEYTINNTFSSVRENILNWYPFKAHATILEVGAGMGAITGMLCDRADSVTAIEMSAARAEVIRARYCNRNNLKIISEDINNWETVEKFDYIVFIGVLEYAAVFSESKKPYDEFLISAKRLLNENGKILFAIENRFGLKYWLGASEDHLQQPFVGIKGYKEERTPRTFSKKELETILDRVGLVNHRIYSVLPDYKFPELIFSEDCAPDYMNLKKVSFTYSKNSSLVADEKELYKDIIDNGVFPFFANSFLVEASVEKLEDRYVVHVSAKGEVYKDFRVNTIMDNTNRVYKIPMHKNARTHINNIVANTEYLAGRGVAVLAVIREGSSIYSEKYSGVSAQRLFQNALEKNQIDLIHKLIDELKKNYVKSSDIVEYNVNNVIVKNQLNDKEIDYGPILQKAFIDMTFYNAFWENGQLIFFDQEWCFERVPLRYCLYYSIKSAYTRVDVRTDITLKEILEYVDIDEMEIAAYNRLEEYLWSNVLCRQTDFYGGDGYCNRYSEDITLYRQNRMLEECKVELENKELLLENRNIDLENENIDLENKILDLENRKQEEITRKNQEIGRKEQELEQKEQQIGQRDRMLAELNERYEAVMHSIGWRMVSFPGKVYEKCFPVESLGRKRIKMASKYVGAVNLTNIKFVGDAFRKGGIRQVRKELNAFEYRVNGIAEIPLDAPQTDKIPKIKDLSKCKKLVFRKSEKPVVSIIIPVYNQFEYTYVCLKSILKNSDRVKYEIIIADDVSNDLTKQIREVVENIRVIRNKKNLNFLRNCNHAARYANGKYILFLNNDTQVQENWLRPLVELMESDETVGMVGSKLIYPDGRLQEAGGIIWGDGHAWNYGNGQNPENPEFNYVKEVDYISGASIMIRASLWKQIGGFDDRFAPAYCEDSDLAFEVRKHGYKLMYQPLSVVVHFEGKSNGTDTSAGIKKYQVINSRKFADKWKEELKQQSLTEDDLFYARDRSQGKKTILVIDHYVPQYDKDAGSKTTWQYLKMFVDRGYNVKFIGDNFYQHEPYTTQLQQMGIEVLYGAWYANHYKQWIMDHKDEIDFAYLNRPHITVKYIDFLKSETNIKCIYYGHDLHFLRIRREYELSGDKKFLEESKEWKETELSIMRKADMSYYPSCVEAEEIHNIDPSINVKAITAYVYDKFIDGLSVDFSKREGILFVGGFGHPPNEDAVLWFVEEVYPLICTQQCIPFYIVGSNATERVKKIKRDGVIMKGFVTEEELTKLYNSCKLVVVPLRYGAGVKGKVVEALYNGTPMVSTSVGIEGITGADQIIEVADAPRQFADKVLALYNDKAKLKQTVSDYQNYVKKNHSIDAVWNIIKDDFQ